MAATAKTEFSIKPWLDIVPPLADSRMQLGVDRMNDFDDHPDQLLVEGFLKRFWARNWKGNTWLLLATAVLVCSVSFYLLQRATPDEVMVHPDTVRDLLLQKACSSGECPLVGPSTSVSPIYQGGVWILHLAMMNALGADVDDIQTTAIALTALSIAVLFLLSARTWGIATGVVASWLMLYVLNERFYFWATVWNPSLLPLPCVLVLLSVVLACRSRKPLFYVGSFFLWSICMQIHPISVLVFPGLVLAWVVFPPVNWKVVLLVAPFASFVAAIAMSREALDIFFQEFLAGNLPGGLAATVAVTGCLVLFWFTLPFISKVVARHFVAKELHRSRGAWVASILPGAAGILAIMCHGDAIDWDRYLAPALAPTALAGALVIVRGGGKLLCIVGDLGRQGWRLRQLLSFYVGILIMYSLSEVLPLVPQSPKSQGWSFQDVSAVARRLRTMGITTLEDAGDAVVAPWRSQLIYGLMLELPPKYAAAVSDPGQSGLEVLVFHSVESSAAMEQFVVRQRKADAPKLYVVPVQRQIDRTKARYSALGLDGLPVGWESRDGTETDLFSTPITRLPGTNSGVRVDTMFASVIVGDGPVEGHKGTSTMVWASTACMPVGTILSELTTDEVVSLGLDNMGALTKAEDVGRRIRVFRYDLTESWPIEKFEPFIVSALDSDPDIRPILVGATCQR